MVQANWVSQGRRRGSRAAHFHNARSPVCAAQDSLSSSADRPAATAHWDNSECTRSPARSCSHARSSAAPLSPFWRSPRERQCRGEQTGPAVEGHAPGVRSGQGARLPSARATQRQLSRCVGETAGFVCPALAGAPLARRERVPPVWSAAPRGKERRRAGACRARDAARSLALPWGHSGGPAGAPRGGTRVAGVSSLRQQGVDWCLA